MDRDDGSLGENDARKFRQTLSGREFPNARRFMKNMTTN
jgi:hypothetical protein